ncbi:hypothetical protein F2Q70_00043837 [Brassica cretica]|uniref:Uncharacterized protein n=1 Tax=Brassica cretica TaxID=69181 RepID=A0A8S9KIN0_BRACR|nr:hypothetical protein F2Q70_00043837 [Brassica cretica]
MNPNPITSLVPASVPVSASFDQLQPQGVPDHRRTQPQLLTRTVSDPTATAPVRRSAVRDPTANSSCPARV